MTNWACASKWHVPATKKKDEQVAAFREDFAQRLAEKVPDMPERPVVLWAMDETRLGLHTIRRRRLTARGVKPVGVQQQRFENVYVYGAVAPLSGESHFSIAAWMNSEMFGQYMEQFAAQFADRLNVVLVDNSRTHMAKSLVLPPNVVLLFQPPYAPELNPAERVWQALKTALAWERFETLGSLCQRVVALIEGWSEEMLRSLTAYPYIMSALNARCS